MLYPVLTQSRLLSDLSGVWDFKLDNGKGFEEKTVYLYREAINQVGKPRTSDPWRDAGQNPAISPVHDTPVARVCR